MILDGPGGHIFPAQWPRKCASAAGASVWLGNPDGMEARLVPQHGFEMVWVKFAALRGKGLLRKLLLPLNLLRGFWQAQKAISKVQPDVVLGMGGYITFPGGMMASLLGKPLVVHEQNSVAGLANRVLAGVADRILTGFPDVFKKGSLGGQSGTPGNRENCPAGRALCRTKRCPAPAGHRRQSRRPGAE
jgi:UDP-N-acetylglucosamine--N-acetylmuramyl-(pentapeptide) pyrophosphoryl-undecaprenol N-acetylglucosamine transferase